MRGLVWIGEEGWWGETYHSFRLFKSSARCAWLESNTGRGNQKTMVSAAIGFVVDVTLGEWNLFRQPRRRMECRRQKTKKRAP